MVKQRESSAAWRGTDAASSVGSEASGTGKIFGQKIGRGTLSRHSSPWLRAGLANVVDGCRSLWGLAWDVPGIGLKISVGDGPRLKAHGDVLIINVDRVILNSFEAAAEQARLNTAPARLLADMLGTMSQSELGGVGSASLGDDAREFARRIGDCEPLCVTGCLQLGPGAGLIVPQRVPILHTDRQLLEVVPCADFLADFRVAGPPASSATVAMESKMIRVERFKTDAPQTFKAATALTMSGNERHVDHIVAGALNPINGAVRILHETDVRHHCHPSRRGAKPFDVDQFLPALRAYLSGEGDDFLKAEAPAIMPSHGSIVGVMPIAASGGRRLQGRQVRFFLYVSHLKDEASALEDTILDHHLDLSALYVKELRLDSEADAA